MSSLPAAASPMLTLFSPPYESLEPCAPEMITSVVGVDEWKGCAVVWQLSGDSSPMVEYDLLRNKVPGLPLLILLPPPSEIRKVIDVVPLLRLLSPRLILPYGLLDTPARLRQVLAMPPRSLPAVVTDYLVRRGLLRRRKVVQELRRIFELAPDTSSISVLARRMYTSRRTLGRHFTSTGLPVPSHCLHFARLLNVAVHLQHEQSPIFKIATRFGYPDGFTMSNQMKRLCGHRPSEVRELLGWEWIVEAWLDRE
jgi:AraC-like DNA-binding protein